MEMVISQQQSMRLNVVADKVREFLTMMDDVMPHQDIPFETAVIENPDEDLSVMFLHPNVKIHIEYKE